MGMRNPFVEIVTTLLKEFPDILIRIPAWIDLAQSAIQLLKLEIETIRSIPDAKSNNNDWSRPMLIERTSLCGCKNCNTVGYLPSNQHIDNNTN